MTTTIRYAIRMPDGTYLNGKGGGLWSWKSGTPANASIWQRKATATQAANRFGDGATVVPVEVLLP